MKVHLIDEKNSNELMLKPLCGKQISLDFASMKEKQFLVYPNQMHLVDCEGCLEKFADTQKEYELGEPIIQLYSPYSYHGSAAIVLNEKGRQKLIDALRQKKRITIIDAFVEDGEGFDLGVFVLPEHEIRKMQDPYLHSWNDNSLADPREDAAFHEHKKDRDMEHA